NEPGVYITGEYGIRTENLVLTTLDEKTDFAEFYKFETLTLCPIDKAGIDTSLLTDAEITWLNNYHQMVFEKLSPELSEEETEWLKQATAPISR
ncbi:MAG TPA: M24 family metallopeptidase C-terminal domain-containing protein, partial [Candidatus Gallibacteroides avistercoris]|nr:M24 family metallopeptidase C-terminal domain-containing protein [Candidatus Gallibacteroides avistercoris]